MTELNVGKKLQAARKAAGLSVEQLAEKLCLSVDKVDLLEKNNFGMLSAPTYVAGYIRSYCDEVKLDVEPFLDAYHQSHLDDEPQLSSTSNQPVQMDAKDPRFISMTIAVLLVLFVLIGIWAWESFKVNDANVVDADTPLPEIEAVFNGLDEQSAEQVDETSLALKTELQEQASEVIEQADSSTEEFSVSDEVTVAEEESANIDAGSVEEQVKTSVLVESNGQAPSGGDTVIVTVTSQSWVNVKDANGYRLYYNMLNPSQGSIIMKGKAPFDVVLGDASAVKLSINSNVYNVIRHMRTDKSARFSVE